MEGGSEEKKLLCCFVVANKRKYDFYALDLSKASEEGDDQNYELDDGDDGGYIPPEVDGDDLIDAPGEGDDVHYLLWDDMPPAMNHLPRLPDPFLTIPKIRLNYAKGFPHRMAFGLLGGMLYMVSPCGKVHVFNTRDITCSPAAPLDHSVCVTIGPALNAPKQDPVVIPLAGKLFVFCRSLYPDPEYTEHVIEVLDPENKCWSPIQLPPTLIEFANSNPWKIEDLLLSRKLDIWNPYLIESYGMVGSSIVLCLSMCGRHNIELFVLDAETLSWKIHPHITKMPYWGVCLFLDGVWCSGKARGGVFMKEEGMEDHLVVPLPSKELNYSTRGKAVRVDDTTVLVFSYGMKYQRYCYRCPDYFKVDMLRVDKSKRDKDGVEKLTANVVESKDFFFEKYNPDFQLAYCYSLSY